MVTRSTARTRPSTKKPSKVENAAQQPIVKCVDSFASFLAELNDLGYVEKKLWYRGIGDASYALTPSLFRHKTAKNQSAFKKLEHDLNETFEMRSLPYAESRNWANDEWERLFYMQHYRVPTRLLDWSGSPLVSMHFAVTSVGLDKSGNALSDVAIWILDPDRWNNAVYADTGFPGGVLSAKDSWLKRYGPSEVYTSSGALAPVAMRGVHNSARIVAQQGFFTVFGPQPESMESIFGWVKDGSNVFPGDCLRKYVIPKVYVKQVRDEIFSLGISESSIYPDLEGLAVELKRTFGF